MTLTLQLMSAITAKYFSGRIKVVCGHVLRNHGPLDTKLEQVKMFKVIHDQVQKMGAMPNWSHYVGCVCVCRVACVMLCVFFSFYGLVSHWCVKQSLAT